MYEISVKEKSFHYGQQNGNIFLNEKASKWKGGARKRKEYGVFQFNNCLNYSTLARYNET